MSRTLKESLYPEEYRLLGCFGVKDSLDAPGDSKEAILEAYRAAVDNSDRKALKGPVVESLHWAFLNMWVHGWEWRDQVSSLSHLLGEE